MHLLEYKITGVKNVKFLKTLINLPVVDSMKTDMNFITGQTYYINPERILMFHWKIKLLHFNKKTKNCKNEMEGLFNKPITCI